MNLSKVMRGDVSQLCLLVTLAVGYVSGDSICKRGETWWDREHSVCTACTRCDPRRLAVLYPCEPHRDTVCQSLVHIQLFPYEDTLIASTNSESDYEPDYGDYDSEVNSNTDNTAEKWDLQASSVTIAASGCVIFFIVVLYFSIAHAKQWTVLKQTLQSDMQDLTAKMKLMEAGGDSPSEPISSADHHLYCNVHVGKDALLGPESAKKGLGNVYTQEKHPS